MPLAYNYRRSFLKKNCKLPRRYTGVPHSLVFATICLQFDMDTVKFKESQVKSADSTTISYLTTGNGPGLLIVHGSLRSATDYKSLASRLAGTFTVHIIDRRGRNNSGPQGDQYSFKTEVQDVAAVMENTGSEYLFGHSFGGTIALEVAFAQCPLSGLAVYEPAISIDNSISVKTLPQIRNALAQENFKEAFIKVMKTVSDGAVPDEQLPEFAEAIARYPIWPELCKLLPTTLEEIRVVHEANNTYAKYNYIRVAPLFLYGGSSPGHLVDQTGLLASVIAGSKVVKIDGARHSGPVKEAFEKIANELKHWFTKT